MTTVFKTKSQLREESVKALKEFLRKGGQIEVVKAKSSNGSRTWMKR
jgi:hypothetical protein